MVSGSGLQAVEVTLNASRSILISSGPAPAEHHPMADGNRPAIECPEAVTPLE